MMNAALLELVDHLYEGAVRAIAFISDPEAQARPNVTLLQHLCAISEATAKTQLRRLLERTNTSRQADLVRVLISLRAK